jgi:predicted HD superfamily hydrolase involved in NAD metabolism
MNTSKPGSSTDLDRLYAVLFADLRKALSPGRFGHSVAVGRLAGKLCLRFGADTVKGRVAGLGHDIARELSAAETLNYVKHFRLPAGKWEREHPVTLHGLVGRDRLQREYGVRDREILDAVADHVLGRPRMGLLSQILYAADFLEPERGFLTGAERAALLRLPLDTMVVRVTEKISGFLVKDGKPIAPRSKKMYDYFNSKKKE